METIAVYWESRIKTYGFNKLNNLSLFEFYYPEEKVTELGKVLSNANFQDIKTKFMILQRLNDGISLVFCLSESDGSDFHASLKNDLALKSYKYLYPVGILFFHGPHFGDRYGIADAAFSPLLEAGIKIISSGCSSASIFLVIAQDDLKRAEEALSKTFDSAK
jgi:aspartokinase